MIKETRTIITERCSFGADDLDEIIKAKESFIESYAEAKRKAKADQNDHDAKVDVCFYRVLIKKVNNIIHVIRTKGVYFDDVNRSVDIQRSKEPFGKNHVSLKFQEEAS